MHISMISGRINCTGTTYCVLIIQSVYWVIYTDIACSVSAGSVRAQDAVSDEGAVLRNAVFLADDCVYCVVENVADTSQGV